MLPSVLFWFGVRVSMLMLCRHGLSYWLVVVNVHIAIVGGCVLVERWG
jgi:hypothetical protein